MSVFIYLFFLCTKTPKHVNITLYEEKKNINKPVAKPPETCHLGVLNVLGSKTLKKKARKTHYMGKQDNINKIERF